MVDYQYAELYGRDSVDKQLCILTEDGAVTITNQELHSENFTLTESLCSESQLRFGCCEASMIKFKISNVFTSLKGKWMKVTERLAGHTDAPFSFGRYKVYSDMPTADRLFREVTAYDAMYDVINADVAAWYHDILPAADSSVTLKQFRTSFLAHFGLQQEAVTLVNDSMTVTKTIEPEQLSGREVITAICELNGCFGHMGRDGSFRYIFLPKYIQGLYPANDLYPADEVYPRNPDSEKIGNSLYWDCKYEDFVTERITKLQIRQEENDIGAISGTGDNCYIVQDNFLVYGKSAQELQGIADRLLTVIEEIAYRPYQAECKGNPCLEVGDAIRFATRFDIVESYILKRTLSGIQALRDSYEAEGEKVYEEKVNSVRSSIIQLKGKTNVLERSVEETRSEITDVEQNLSSKISQNASAITAEVKRAQGQESALSASIKVNAEKIETKVTNGDVSSTISQESGKIAIRSNRLSISSDNFSLSENGTVTATNGNFTGRVTATSGSFSGTVNATDGSFSGTVNATSGTFENVRISESCTVAGQSVTGTVNGGYIGSGIRAGNITSGNISRPIYYSGDSSFDENGLTSRTGTSNFSDIKVAEILPIIPYAAGGANIGSSAYNEKFATIYAATFVGSVQEASSREVKENIAPVTSDFCLESVRNTGVNSYNYTDDLADITKVRKELETEMNEYLNSRKKTRKRGETDKIALYQRRLAALDAADEKIPAKRYGFIAEEAPEDIVSKDRKTVDLYSCIAMAYGAIQALEQKIDRLEQEMEEMKHEQDLQQN